MFPEVNNRTTPVSTSGQHSPSLIILDSDSPPTTPTPTPTPTPVLNMEIPKRPPPPYSAALSYLASQSHFLDLDSDSTYPRY